MASRVQSSVRIQGNSRTIIIIHTLVLIFTLIISLNLSRASSNLNLYQNFISRSQSLKGTASIKHKSIHTSDNSLDISSLGMYYRNSNQAH